MELLMVKEDIVVSSSTTRFLLRVESRVEELLSTVAVVAAVAVGAVGALSAGDEPLEVRSRPVVAVAWRAGRSFCG
jgi:hypothetical protein